MVLWQNIFCDCNNFLLFSVIWALGGAIEETDREKFSNFFKEVVKMFPCALTVYDYFVDEKLMFFNSIVHLLNTASWYYNPK